MVIGRRKAKGKEQGDQEICPGIGLDIQFGLQQENRIFTLLMKGFLVYLLVGGGLGAYLSALDIDYGVAAVQAVLLLGALFCALLYYSKLWENIGYFLLFLFICFVAYGLRRYINSGFYSVLNDMADITSGYFELNAMRSYGEQIGNRYLAITVSMSFMGLIACILLNIMVSRRMEYFLVIPAALGILLLPLYMERNPSPVFTIMLLTGLLIAFILKGGRHYGLTQNNQKYQRKKTEISYVYDKKIIGNVFLSALCLVALLTAVWETVLPRQRYDTIYRNSHWKESTMDTVGNLSVLGIAGLLNFYPTTGGLLNGRLGGVSSVVFDYNTDLTVKLAPYTYGRIYLKTYTGAEYIPYQNRWSRGGDAWAEEEECREAKALKKAYEKGKKYSARAYMEIENVAAAAGYYVPYYSREMDQSVYPGEKAKYEFYPWLEGASVSMGQSSNPQLWLEVPPKNQDAVAAFIEEAGLGGSPEEIVEQLAEYYQQNIPYTVRPGATPRGQDFINFFLQKNRKGYCAHFASAATLILRQLGIPARYVEGYAIDYTDITEDGELLPQERYEDYYDGYSPMGETGVVQLDVTDANAHAWVEIYQEGKGWQVVELTPYSQEEEEASPGFWSIFMRFLNSAGGQADQAGEETDNAGFTVDEHTKEVSKNILGAVLLTVALALGVWRLCLWLGYLLRYQRSGYNDRVVMEYGRRMKGCRKKHPELAGQLNYETQIRWMAAQDLWKLEKEEEERITKLLEQAGFASKELEEEDYQWVRRLLRLIGKKRRKTDYE